MQGLVIKSTGSWYQVYAENGKNYDCRIKGKFRIQGIQTTNPIAVGDKVVFELEPNAETGVIDTLLDRKNYIIRQSPKNRTARHIIASNIDQLVIVATIAQPRTSTGFIDRCLTTAGAYHIPAIIIFNKKDLFNEKDLIKLDEYVNIYTYSLPKHLNNMSHIHRFETQNYHIQEILEFLYLQFSQSLLHIYSKTYIEILGLKIF